MLEKTNSRLFTFLLGFSAMLLASMAAVFSITGVSMLYAGSLVYVAIMMGGLEFAKIITASFLYRYWKAVPKSLKVYLTIGLLILMILTSAGIFGYLTSSYQGSTIGLEKINSQSQVLDQRKGDLVAERERLINDISTLRNERQSTIQNRNGEIAANNIAIDSVSIKNRSWRNSQVYKRYDEELTRIDNNISKYVANLDSTNAKLSRIGNEISDKKLELIDTGADVGPLLYIARLFNIGMDTVVKWFTLIIIFVFDPLAIALIIAMNMVIQKSKEERISIEGKQRVVSVSTVISGDETERVEELTKPKRRRKKTIVVKEETDLLQSPPDDFNLPAAATEQNPIIIEEAEKIIQPININQEEMETQNKEDAQVFTSPVVAEEVDPKSTQLVIEPEIIEEVVLEPDIPEPDKTEEDDILPEPDKEEIDNDVIPEPIETIPVEDDKIPEPDEEHEGEIPIPDKIEEITDDAKSKHPITSDEIKEYFDNAVKEVKEKRAGQIETTMFSPGGSVIISREI